jgi:hypothetical protein
MKAFEAERVLRRMTSLPDQIIDPLELRWRTFASANTLVVRGARGGARRRLVGPWLGRAAPRRPVSCGARRSGHPHSYSLAELRTVAAPNRSVKPWQGANRSVKLSVKQP